MTINFQALPHAGIRTLVPYVPGKAIEELAREKGLTDIIKLASNENPLGCSPHALEALYSMSSHLVATYPSPTNHPIIPKLAAKHKLETNQVFVSNGSDQIFGLLLNCFALHTSKHILVHDYAFSTYAIQAHSLNIPVHTVAIDANWQVDIDRLAAACNQETALIFIANPNNPTGQLIPQAQIQKLLEQIPETTIVVLDEAYYEFAQHHFSHPTETWLAQYPNLIITRTHSKIYGLAGLRFGYALADAEIVTLLHRVQLPFTVNQAALTCAHAALDDITFIHQSLENNSHGMEQVTSGLNNLQLEFIPSACNFITFNSKEDGLKLYNFLLDKGIIVRPLHPYKMDKYIRVTIGTPTQNSRFLAAMGEYYHR